MAFMRGTLSEEIFMRIPDGFKEHNQRNLKGEILKLNKALDYLKQSDTIWYKLLENGLIEMSLKQSSSDRCDYNKINQNDLVIETIYVDDLLIFSNSIMFKNWVFKYTEQLKKWFEMKDLGIANYYLGIKIECNREKGYISLNQTQYMEKMLCKYNMYESRPVTTLIKSKFIGRFENT